MLLAKLDQCAWETTEPKATLDMSFVYNDGRDISPVRQIARHVTQSQRTQAHNSSLKCTFNGHFSL